MEVFIMEIVKVEKEGVEVISLIGRLDAGSAVETEFKLKDVTAENSLIVIDLNRLEYISSAGLRVLLVSAKAIRKKSGAMALFGLTDNVREVFDISGFSAIFDIANDEVEAIKIVKDI